MQQSLITPVTKSRHGEWHVQPWSGSPSSMTSQNFLPSLPTLISVVSHFSSPYPSHQSIKGQKIALSLLSAKHFLQSAEFRSIHGLMKRFPRKQPLGQLGAFKFIQPRYKCHWESPVCKQNTRGTQRWGKPTSYPQGHFSLMGQMTPNKTGSWCS